MSLTKEQLDIRDAEIDWHLAKLCFHAEHQFVWADYSPTSNWSDGGKIIEKYNVDIRWYDPKLFPTLEGQWVGGLQVMHNQISKYYIGYGDTPLLAAMRAVVKAYPNAS